MGKVSDDRFNPSPSPNPNPNPNKVSDDRFNLDWRAPLSAVQAFGIALSV